MGQKVNPIGFRVGITEPWSSTWYAPKAAYGAFLIEDHKLRKYIDRKLNRRPPFAAIARIDIERTREEVTITLRTARKRISSATPNPMTWWCWIWVCPRSTASLCWSAGAGTARPRRF